MIGPSFGPAEWRAIAPFAAVIVSAIGCSSTRTFSGDAKDAETSLWFRCSASRRRSSRA
jgi:hypothetical protein